MHFEKSLSGCIGEKQVRTVARQGDGYGGKESWMEIKISEGVWMGWRWRERLLGVRSVQSMVSGAVCLPEPWGSP